jgi:hypothetical protein
MMPFHGYTAAQKGVLSTKRSLYKRNTRRILAETVVRDVQIIESVYNFVGRENRGRWCDAHP